MSVEVRTGLRPVLWPLDSRFEWGLWKMNRLRSARTTPQLPSGIRSAVEGLFDQAGLPRPYVLHRTCHWIRNPPPGAHGFTEAPDNLLPSQRSLSGRTGWTVYLMFGQAPPTMGDLRELLAFPDSREDEFQLLKVVRLGAKKKADTRSLPAGVWFPTLAALRRDLLGAQR